ncbi:DNA repair protein RadA, partial [Enterobacter asburiae]
MYLTRGFEITTASSFLVVWEVTPPGLVEMRRVVEVSMMATPRRVAVGVKHNRVAIVGAGPPPHGGLQMADEDVFVYVV